MEIGRILIILIGLIILYFGFGTLRGKTVTGGKARRTQTMTGLGVLMIIAAIAIILLSETIAVDFLNF